MKKMTFKDKDLIISKEGFIFLARGYQQSNFADVILKYYPSSKKPYFTFKNKKYTWNKQTPNPDFLCTHPEYYSPASITLNRIHSFQVKEILSPKSGYARLIDKEKLDPLESTALKFGKMLEENGIPAASLGVTGTMLLGTHNPTYSDIDFVIQGSKNYRLATEFVRTSLDFKPFSLNQWKRYYARHNIKSKYAKNFKQFLKTAQRKHDRLIFNNKPLSIFNKRNENEIRETEKVINLQRIKAMGKIVADKENSFHPAYYQVNITQTNIKLNVDIKEIVAYGREYYSEGFKGDNFKCEGRLQFVMPKNKRSYFRIEIGYLDDSFLPQGTLNIL